MSDEKFAAKNPWKWQKRENLCFADYLEHLFLHILICQYPAKKTNKWEAVGIGGVINHLVPILNDYYSGLVPEKTYDKTCFAKVVKDRDVYVLLVQRFMKHQENHYNPHINYEHYMIFLSKNLGIWDSKKNEELYREICPFWESFKADGWAHDGGDECLSGGKYMEEYCPNCKNPICYLDFGEEEEYHYHRQIALEEKETIPQKRQHK